MTVQKLLLIEAPTSPYARRTDFRRSNPTCKR